MTALFDEDPARDAEAIAQRWVQYQRDEIALEEAAGKVLHEVREYLVSIAVARQIGEPDEGDGLAASLNAYVAGVIGEEHGASILAKALYDAVWCGGRSVEREARDRLIRLRDVPDNGIVTAISGGAP